MLAVLLLATTAQAPLAADFFPTVPGRKLTYVQSGATKATSTDTYQGQVKVGDILAFEVVTRVAESAIPANSMFYSVEGDTVAIVASGKAEPLAQPMPILKVGAGKTSWTYAGKVGRGETVDGVGLKGQSELKGTRDVLGKRVPVLEVRLDIVMGTNAAQEQIEQRATYAKGIGLVELYYKTKLGKAMLESTLKLVKIEDLEG